MNRIPKNTRLKIYNPPKLKITKNNPVVEKTIKTNNKLERTPGREYFDYSTEDKGFFTRRDAKGRVLEVIEILFPR